MNSAECKGAFDRTLRGFRHCVDAGQKVGPAADAHPAYRSRTWTAFLISSKKRESTALVFITSARRARGKSLMTLTPAESRTAMDTIFDRIARSGDSRQANGNPHRR